MDDYQLEEAHKHYLAKAATKTRTLLDRAVIGVAAKAKL